MNYDHRQLLVPIVGCVVAMFLAYQIGQGDLVLPVIAIVVCFLVTVYVIFFREFRLEGVILAALLLGNLVGQKGFAHISLAGATPIYFSEVCLIACFSIFCLRTAFTKEPWLSRDPLSIAVLLFLLVGTVRFAFDLNKARGGELGMVVIRDFATVYYAAFFFLAFRLAQDAPTRRLLERTVAIGLILMIPGVVVLYFAPGFMYETLSLRAQPIMLPRSDLIGSYWTFGFAYYMLSRETLDHAWVRTVVAFAGLGTMLFFLSRAVFLGFGGMLIILLIAGRWRIIAQLVLVALMGIIVLGIYEQTTNKRRDEQFTTRFLDKATSMFDIEGEKTYRSETGETAFANNRFRSNWWKAVYDETMEVSPLTGLGFGYDLAARFLRSHDAQIDPDAFDVRSPHNILFTIFGRMGLVGLASFGCVLYLIARYTLRCARLVRSGKVPPTDLAPWCGVVATFVIACLGVMLEGPMAAIVFWTLLGMAWQQMLAREEAKSPHSPEVTREPSHPAPPLYARPPLPIRAAGRL